MRSPQRTVFISYSFILEIITKIHKRVEHIEATIANLN